MVSLKYNEFKIWLCCPFNLFIFSFFAQLVVFSSTNYIYCMHEPNPERLASILEEVEKLNGEIANRNNQISVLTNEASQILKAGTVLPPNSVSIPIVEEVGDSSILDNIVGLRIKVSGRFLSTEESGLPNVVFRGDPESVIQAEPALNSLQANLGSLGSTETMTKAIRKVESGFPTGQFPLGGKTVDFVFEQKQISKLSSPEEPTTPTLQDSRRLGGAIFNHFIKGNDT